MFEFQSSAVRKNGGYWIREFEFHVIHLVLLQKLKPRWVLLVQQVAYMGKIYKGFGFTSTALIGWKTIMHELQK